MTGTPPAVPTRAVAGADAAVLEAVGALGPPVTSLAPLQTRAAATLPLQLANPTAIQLAVLALAAGSAILGLFIAALAFRALLRTPSRQMLFLGVGMTLLFGIAYGVALAGSVLLELRYLPIGSQDVVWLGVRAVQFVGLACIAYSLWIGRSRSSATGRAGAPPDAGQPGSADEERRESR